MKDSIPIAQTALLIVDLQNDFLHPEGAYGRARQSAPAIAELPNKIKPLADTLRAAGGFVISTQFTLVPAKAGEPLISPHLQALRPFLTKGDFAPGSWGHRLVDELQPADIMIEKIAYSAFYMTRMDWVIRKINVRKLYIAGIVTNGGVASTARDAHVRDLAVTVLSDGCAAFSAETHEIALRSLETVCEIAEIATAIAEIEAASAISAQAEIARR